MGKAIIFDRTEKNFNTRGLGIIKNALTCNVEEMKNGAYEAYLEVYLYDNKASLLKEENILYCSTPSGYQAFRIYRAYKNEKENLLQVYACHIFYDNEDNFIEDTNIVNKDGFGAINQLFSKTVEPHNFTVLSDVPSIANSRIVRKSPIAALMDSSEDNSLINRWGGELVRDNWTIKLLTKYGTDRGVNIKYGKNLKGLTVDTNMKGIATKIMPQGFDGLFIPEKYVESPLINNYEHVKVQKYEFPSIKAQVDGEELKEGELTKEEAYEALRNAVKDLYDKEKVDVPKATLKVNFIELSKMEQYKEYAVLERIYPFDTITIKHSLLNMNIKVDMNYYKWDSLRDKYISIECGSTISNFVQNAITVEKVKEQMTSALAEAKATATSLINNGLGGYTLKTRDEFLIMDTDNINTARKIWRWNINGLGYSNTGYNGTFGLAMTMDGAIVADFITAGNINASLIKTGVISSNDGRVTIDINGNDGITISGGALTVRNDNSVVVIDGKYNMFKIYVTGIANVYFDNSETISTTATVQIAHNFGYPPAFQCYVEGESGYIFNFPYYEFINQASEYHALGVHGRAWCNNEILEISFRRPEALATSSKNYKVRYYIFKEVAM